MLYRRCRVDDRGDAGGLWLIGPLRGDCNGRHVAPDAKGGVAGRAVSGRGEAVTVELKVIVDAAMGREEGLRVTS